MNFGGDIRFERSGTHSPSQNIWFWANPSNGDGNPVRSDTEGPDLAAQRSESLFLRPRRPFAPGPPFAATNTSPARPLAAVPPLQAMQGQAPPRASVPDLRLLWASPEAGPTSRAPQLSRHARVPMVARVLGPGRIGK